LIEVVIALGVLATALPLVFGTFAKSGESAAAAKAETRCNWIIPACLDEIEAARLGQSRFLPKREPGSPYPPSGETLALAFTDEGLAVAKVPPRAYAAGTKSLNGESVRYLVSIHAEPEPGAAGDPAAAGAIPLSTLRLTLEYPAAAPSHKRRTLDFHTRIP
jgi:type II secretory pathway pseudopilin PulG